MTGTLKNSKKKNGGQVCWEHQQNHATKHKQLDKGLDQSDSCLNIICRILLTSNHMIFLEQFGINKHLHIFKRSQIALTQRACTVLLVFKKFIRAYLFQIALKVITYTNRIVFDAVRLLFYTTPIETIGETGSTWKRCQKRSVFKTIRVYLACKQRNRIALNTVTILARNFIVQFKMVNLACSAALAYTIMTLIFRRKRFLVNTSNRIDFDAVSKSCCHVDVKPMLIHKGHAAN